MILIADSGSTKTAWCLTDGKSKKSIMTQGINPFLQSEQEISAILQHNIESRGFFPLFGFCGHGIGTQPHAEPNIPNYLESNTKIGGPKVRNGMVFCLEPMVCQKSSKSKILADKWSVVSEDGLNTSHHEHTVAMIDGRAKILTEL